ncbi:MULTISPECIES: peptide chain release factor 3 [unclassified Brevundimonas]|jgi:peptide chain release factor 3|uniref:peptide chain release factor 3 n=1 Tax=unclassified Brevundimonas TaxID=2622653 RepID=UPI000C5C1DD2|nr:MULTISPECIES: peptide chain release factor 3 [unclassified Brevundimonas]MAL89078.1 peptide chain release factor 3 [Brevundimonas sp.]HAJ02570.1 peptide chain release factor 3 [Brevundimonas sp.]HAV50733.1 peptide chain release factor 3 [Brevundimonas sp.]|tara:strand:- start:25262 stop:26905 length:1644 start_codon:yes stop_codon:yes gene_type:complete
MSQASLAQEASRRRTFAIIAHPDAGKTTLTEHILLAGGAIRAAGAVRARGENRRTRSDWMKIEKERGISVSASVMTFEHDGKRFNLLDTPGHEDFSEDTYRTLTAADCAIMVLDAAKGIEPQTLKLFEVCRLRDIPIITFINKLDREAQDPMALLDEIASRLQLDPAPIWWPAESGNRLRGMVEVATGAFQPYARKAPGAADEPDHPEALPLDQAGAYFEEGEQASLQDALDLVREGYPTFDVNAFLEGHMTPVLWGSALRHFGIEALLQAIGTWAPSPKVMKARKEAPPETRNAPAPEDITIQPGEDQVTGFVFKVQANMDPNHRDRIAMFRMASGSFKRGMKLKVQNTGKSLSVNAPIMFFASDRELAEEAHAGDVMGIPNHGVLRVGDSLSETGLVRFAGLPNFAPEILQRVRVKDPLKAKHLKKALDGLAEEGVTQLFRPEIGADFIVGAVGQLQFEVMADRLGEEYGLDVIFEPSPYAEARWIAPAEGATRADVEDFMGKYRPQMAGDLDSDPVFLAKTSWETGYVTERFPKVRFLKTKERG